MPGQTTQTDRPLPDAAGDRVLRYPPGALVILTGLPGAGKSTMLRRLYAMDGTEAAPVVVDGVTVIDSAQSKARWAGTLGRAPGRVRTAVVFATHLLRIRRALAAGGPVIAHNRGCGPLVLRVFARMARRRGAAFHLLLLDAGPEAALAGQRARARVVRARTFSYHRRRCEALLARVRAGTAAPAAGAVVIDRSAAGLLRGIVFDGEPASPSSRTEPSTIYR
ncbi:AAA family ATPase [Nonomuraea sp. NPDC005501]|uniref:AAA family ATPase n=1 Tax=Nonomuraea sp. NPDC005501 TaxID=3156884 RepID=UPI0033B9CE7A